MDKHTILITGCSSGFGRVTALILAQQGWHVFATVRKAEDRDNLLTEAATHHCQDALTPFVCDITQQEQVAALTQKITQSTPRLDALVNNAGTTYAAPLELLPLDDLRAQFEVNVIAQLGMIQAMLPLLKVAKGTIINVSSVSGRISTPVMGAYSASKFAIEAISDTLRLELAPFGIRVVMIEPGPSPTEIWKTSMERARATLDTYRNGPYARKRGFPPSLFAETVVKILASKKPRARYPIPRAATIQIALRALLPEPLWDYLMRRMFT
jgi:NAD(P)-dependent dehydrogenase (short-subunit alcohol dehydrogenase family)